MKKSCNLLLCALLMTATMSGQAATCRAYSAAQVGSQSGYDRAKKAADAWSEREDQATDALQQCLGDISTSITMPTFPNLADILNGIKDKICAAARDKISDYIPSNIDPWGDLSVSDYSIPTTSVPVSRSAIPTTNSSSPFNLN